MSRKTNSLTGVIATMFHLNVTFLDKWSRFNQRCDDRRDFAISL